MTPALESLPGWLQSESQKHPYSEITLRLIVHDGRMRRIEKTVTEKIQLDQGPGK